MLWPLPGAPTDPVTGKPLVQPPAALSKFVGRYCDSHETRDFQLPWRTVRAGSILFAPERQRIYMAMGEAVFAYGAQSFFDLLAAGTPLVLGTAYPMGGVDRGGHPESYLRPDRLASPELPGSGFNTPIQDGQTRLYAVAYDDRGYVYTAHQAYFGWCIWFDDGASGGGMMTPVYQEYPGDPNFSPASVYAVRNSAGGYFLIVPGITTSAVWDVTNPSAPVRQADIPFAIGQIVKLNDGRIAFIGIQGFVVYSVDTMLSGGAPAFAPVTGVNSLALATDGVNLFTIERVAGVASFTVFKPGAGSFTSQRFSLGGFQPAYVSVGGNYLTVGLFGDTKLFKLAAADFAPTEIPLAGYLGAYYGNPPSGFASPGSFVSPGPVYPFQQGSNIYLIVPAHGLGDVYLLEGNVVVQPPQPPEPCPPMTANNLRIEANGGPISGTYEAEGTILFNVGGTYPFACGQHAFVWNVGGTNRQTSFTFLAPGSFPVSCMITNDKGVAFTASATITIVPKPVQTGCPEMTANNVFVTMNGSSQPQPVNAGDNVAFSVERFPPYNFGCAPHTFKWGTSPPATFVVPPVDRAATLRFTAAGKYTVQCVVNNGTQIFPANMLVDVAGGPPVQTPVPTMDHYDPLHATVGGPQFVLKVFGANFKASSQITVNGQFRTDSVVVNSGQITCLIKANELLTVRDLIIGVGELVPPGSQNFVGADSRTSPCGNFKIVQTRRRPSRSDPQNSDSQTEDEE